MDLGGPVWHASVVPLRLTPRRELERMAGSVLDGVGDRRLGQWVERTDRALHLRRRLSSAEQLLVGPVVDVRGTPEAVRRIHTLPESVLAVVPADVLAEELGDA